MNSHDHKVIPFKKKLGEDIPLYGFFIGPPSPATVEMVGYAGFDFVVLDMEHGPVGFETLENLLRAADASGIGAIVRLPDASAASILHALDCGASGILVPHITTAAEAAAVVEHAYYPPLGRRGISTLSRAGRYGMTPAVEYLASRKDHIVVMVMIEDREALPNVGEIARVDGVDAVFVGPSDLAASMGYTGNAKHPDVIAALDSIWPQVRAANGPTLVTAVRSVAEARALERDGVRLFCFNTTSTLSAALQTLRKDLHTAPAPAA